jgi:hypothetical protein
MTRLLVIPALALGSLLAACSPASPQSGGADPGGKDDDPSGEPSTPVACTADADYGALGAVGTLAEIEADDEDPAVEFITLETDEVGKDADDDFYLELWDDTGVFTGGKVKTGSFQIAGDDTTDADCGACIYLEAAATADGPTLEYIAQSGTLTLTSVSGRLTGSISDVVLQGYDDDAAGTRRPECTTRIASASFDLPLTPAAP